MPVLLKRSQARFGLRSAAEVKGKTESKFLDDDRLHDAIKEANPEAVGFGRERNVVGGSLGLTPRIVPVAVPIVHRALNGAPFLELGHGITNDTRERSKNKRKNRNNLVFC